MGAYRYELRRVWDDARPTVVWICLNPSTADDDVDDLTAKKIRGFSEQWGFGAYLLVNLYPLRATALRKALTLHGRAGVVLAWGAHGGHPTVREHHDRVAARVAELRAAGQAPGGVWCLGTCRNGEPRHPARLAYTTPRESALSLAYSARERLGLTS